MLLHTQRERERRTFAQLVWKPVSLSCVLQAPRSSHVCLSSNQKPKSRAIAKRDQSSVCQSLVIDLTAFTIYVEYFNLLLCHIFVAVLWILLACAFCQLPLLAGWRFTFACVAETHSYRVWPTIQAMKRANSADKQQTATATAIDNRQTVPPSSMAQSSAPKTNIRLTYIYVSVYMYMYMYIQRYTHLFYKLLWMFNFRRWCCTPSTSQTASAPARWVPGNDHSIKFVCEYKMCRKGGIRGMLYWSRLLDTL